MQSLLIYLYLFRHQDHYQTIICKSQQDSNPNVPDVNNDHLSHSLLHSEMVSITLTNAYFDF